MKQELADGDLHSYSACLIYDLTVPQGTGKARFKGLIAPEQRYMGKKMNHSCGYRATPYKLTEAINKEGGITVSLHQVKKWYTAWHQGFLIQPWWRNIEERLRDNDNVLRTTYGREHRFYSFWSDELFKEATAFEPQSTVADHMRGRIHPEFGIPGGIREIRKHYLKYPEIKLLQTAHDSLLLECPNPIVDEVGAKCVELLTRPLAINGETFTIPVDCDIYPKRWGEDKRALATRS